MHITEEKKYFKLNKMQDPRCGNYTVRVDEPI